MAFKKKMARKYTKKLKKVSLQRQIMRLSDSKRFTGEATAFALTSGTVYSYVPTMLLNQGTNNSTRIGDSVYLQDLVINGTLKLVGTAQSNVKFRMIFGWHTKQVASGSLTAGLFGIADIFLPLTASVGTNGIINPRAFTVLSDSVIDVNSTTSTSHDIKSIYYKVPLNQNFDYIAAGSGYGKRKNLVMFLICNDFHSTPTNPVITFAASLKFKDP